MVPFGLYFRILIILKIKIKQARLTETDKMRSNDVYYKFEFISDTSMGVDKSGIISSDSESYMRSYFILDIYSGTIHTAKMLDIENFCDLNLCNNRLLKAISLVNTSLDDVQNCHIEFKIKASQYVLCSVHSSSIPTISTINNMVDLSLISLFRLLLDLTTAIQVSRHRFITLPLASFSRT